MVSHIRVGAELVNSIAAGSVAMIVTNSVLTVKAMQITALGVIPGILKHRQTANNVLLHVKHVLLLPRHARLV